MFKFIKKLLFGETRGWKDIELEMPPTVKLTSLNTWYISDEEGVETQLIYGKVVSIAYNVAKNRLSVTIGDKTTPANITSRSCTTINSRLKKAGRKPIPTDLFKDWESKLIEAQGEGKGTYYSVRYPSK